MVRAGTYRDRVRIEQFVTATDASGGPARTWSPVLEAGEGGEVAAQIMDIGIGQEFFGVGTEVAEMTTRIRIRETPGFNLDPKMRFVDVDRGTIYEMVGIAPTRLREELVIRCKHGGTDR